ncbi:MAG: hypothetical protein JSS29_11885 [Proteobacteria bacterium]|nr:hypothetical protein [Pseudomonadota bacterium]
MGRAPLASAGGFAAAALPWLALLYGAMSLVHFAHNARYLSDYPNLPRWLSAADVWLSWAGLALLGVIGLVLYRHVHRIAGLALLGAWAALGFDGLAHYARAPFLAHTAMMNFTILAEVAAAALLMACVLALAPPALRRA